MNLWGKLYCEIIFFLDFFQIRIEEGFRLPFRTNLLLAFNHKKCPQATRLLYISCDRVTHNYCPGNIVYICIVSRYLSNQNFGGLP